MALDIQIHDHINDDDDYPYPARIGHGGIVTVGGDPTSNDPFVVVSSQGYPAYPEVTLSLHGGNYTYQEGTPALVYKYAADSSARTIQFWADKVADLLGCVCPACDSPVVRAECGGSGEGICHDIALAMIGTGNATDINRRRLFRRAGDCHLRLVGCDDLIAFESR